MGRKCTVPNCLSEEGRYEDRGVTFHKIPLHVDIRPKWMSLCHIPEDKYNVKVVHVCSRHFLKADFCRFKGKKYMLRQGVLPSVFPWSKLKKEISVADDSINIKKEITSEPQENVQSNTEPNIADKIQGTIKMETEIKQEPSDLSEVDVKEEALSPNPGDSLTSVPLAEIDASTGTKKSNLNAFNQKSSTIIEQKGKSIQTSSGVLNFTINTRLEALDFNQMWFPARIIEVDYEENEVLIHFEKYSTKYDEWISMNSPRLRPLQPAAKKVLTDTFVVGEKCMASWSDSRKFPASVTKVIDKDTYEVLFNDGFVKVLKTHRMAKTHGKAVGSAPLFDPVTGTKQDRRDKKRKLNVAQLFRKRIRTDVAEDSSTLATMPVTAQEESSSNSADDPEIWMPKWENGRPVGVDSVIETNDGLRKSVILADPRLPPNWQKHLTQRIHGASAGNWDTVFVSPESRKFRTRAEIKTFLEENPQLNYNESMFDFSLHKKPRTVRRAPPIVTKAPPVNTTPEPSPEEENPNSLKILLIDDAYQCPIEGCGKNFRRENLAQMHVKHYHPKYTKYLDSTPNVADLAYARTVGESLDKSPDRTSKTTPARQGQKVYTPKGSVSRTNVQSPSIESDLKAAQPSADSQMSQSQLQKTKDSEILKLLNSKPPEEQLPKYPPGLPPNMYPDIKLKDLLNKSEGIPKREDLNLKSLIASTSRPTGIKTLLPVVRPEIKKELKSEENQYADQDPWGKNPTNRGHAIRQNIKRKRQASENIEASKYREIAEAGSSAAIKSDVPNRPEQNPGYIVEGGEVIKIVRMKREEIINCTCGVTEEDGLMIQCELCLCWQHAYCNNIERENQVPEKYICFICQNPVRQRSSKKYFHDQDWLKNGTLPVANYHCKDNEVVKKRFEKLKKSHDLSGRLIELKDYMHSLKVKLKIAEAKNHPKLYLWSKQWEKCPLPEKLDLKQETEDIKPKNSSTETQLTKSELDLLTSKGDPQGDSMLFSILKSAKDEQKLKEELSTLSKMDLNTFMDNNLEQLPIPPPIIPQPEAAIDSADCKLNLLDHIAHCQNLVEERLNDVEAQVDLLDSGGSNTDDDFNHSCQTVQMLLRDLSTLKELSQSNSL